MLNGNSSNGFSGEIKFQYNYSVQANSGRSDKMLCENHSKLIIIIISIHFHWFECVTIHSRMMFSYVFAFFHLIHVRCTHAWLLFCISFHFRTTIKNVPRITCNNMSSMLYWDTHWLHCCECSKPENQF